MAYFEELFKEFRAGKTLSFRNGKGKATIKNKRLCLDIDDPNKVEILMVAILVADDWEVEEENDDEENMKKTILEELSENW